MGTRPRINTHTKSQTLNEREELVAAIADLADVLVPTTRQETPGIPSDTPAEFETARKALAIMALVPADAPLNEPGPLHVFHPPDIHEGVDKWGRIEAQLDTLMIRQSLKTRAAAEMADTAGNETVGDTLRALREEQKHAPRSGGGSLENRVRQLGVTIRQQGAVGIAAAELHEPSRRHHVLLHALRHPPRPSKEPEGFYPCLAMIADQLKTIRDAQTILENMAAGFRGGEPFNPELVDNLRDLTIS